MHSAYSGGYHQLRAVATYETQFPRGNTVSTCTAPARRSYAKRAQLFGQALRRISLSDGPAGHGHYDLGAICTAVAYARGQAVEAKFGDYGSGRAVSFRAE